MAKRHPARPDPDETRAVQAGPVTSTGIRELKDNLSRYIRRIEAGERIVITAHGRMVAELVQLGATAKSMSRRFDEFVASGMIRPRSKPVTRQKRGRTSGFPREPPPS